MRNLLTDFARLTGVQQTLSLPPIHEWICEMTESTETAPSKKLPLNRSFWIKVIPVGLFAALGTFAVVQSILGEKNAPAETEQVAGEEASAEAPRSLLGSNENPIEALPAEVAAREANGSDEANEKNPPARS